MAINLDDRYPGRANGKTLSYPQGSFKNRTSPTSKDGTYLEQDWANDWAAFFQSLMSDAGLTANGTVDTAQASQYFDALRTAIQNVRNAAPDTGAVNALAVSLTPAPAALVAGMPVTVTNIVANNTGAATLNVNALGAKPIVMPSGAALSGYEIYIGSAVTFIYTGSSWMLQTRPMTPVPPAMTFAQIVALTFDIGPIFCTDMGGKLYTWQTSAYFTGYRSVCTGEIPNTFLANPTAWMQSMTGGTWSTADPKQARLIAWFQEQGLTVAQASWTPGMGMIASLGSGNWQAPDARNMFWRVSGTDADTANPRLPGHWQIQRVQSIPLNGTDAIVTGGTAGVPAGITAGGTQFRSNIPSMYSIGTGSDTRPGNTAVSPVILI